MDLMILVILVSDCQESQESFDLLRRRLLALQIALPCLQLLSHAPYLLSHKAGGSAFGETVEKADVPQIDGCRPPVPHKGLLYLRENDQTGFGSSLQAAH